MKPSWLWVTREHTMNRFLATRAASLCLALALLTPAVSGQPVVSSAGATAPASRVVSLDVIVSDGSGNAVHGLEAGDFELWLDSAPVPVASVMPASEGAGPADGPLVLVVFVDRAGLAPSACAALLAKAAPALVGAVRTGAVRTMVVSGDGRPAIRQSIGSDPEALRRAIEVLVRECETGGATTGPATPQPITAGVLPVLASDRVPDAPDSMRPGSGRPLASVSATLERVTAFVRSLGGLPGRKALLYIGGPVVGESPARSVPCAAADTGDAAVGHAASAVASEQLRSLSDQANATGVTLYCVEACGAGAAAATQPGSASVTSAWGEVAAATGGQATSDRPDLTDVVTRFFVDFHDYYRVSFVQPSPGDGLRHQVRMRVQRPGATVRTRASFVDLSEDDRMAGRALAALDLGLADNPLGIQVTATAEVNAKEGSQVASVLVAIPLGKLAFEPGTVAQQSDLRLWLAARDGDGKLTQSPGHRFPVSVPNDRFLAALSQSAAYTFRVPMKAGPGSFAVTVRDEIKEQDATAVATVGGTGPTAQKETR
ncbi:MAG: VWA domain-containing protein [Thermoanaerobaculales bacterium]